MHFASCSNRNIYGFTCRRFPGPSSEICAFGVFRADCAATAFMGLGMNILNLFPSFQGWFRAGTPLGLPGVPRPAGPFLYLPFRQREADFPAILRRHLLDQNRQPDGRFAGEIGGPFQPRD